MELRLSNEQYRLMMQIMWLGSHVMDSVAEERDEPLRGDIEKLEDYFISLAGEYDSADMVEKCENGDTYSDDFNVAMAEVMSEFEEQSFWEHLVVRMGQRDLESTLTDEEKKRIESEGELPARAQEIFTGYESEFEEHGVDRLRIVP